MRRVVVTGMGIVSSIGNNTQEVLASLREAKSGILFAPEDQSKMGFRSQVAGARRSTRLRSSIAAPCASWRRHSLESRRDGSGDPRRWP
jgi:3-oxoacyl-(acyl-carrier-protein) synthase